VIVRLDVIGVNFDPTRRVLPHVSVLSHRRSFRGQIPQACFQGTVSSPTVWSYPTSGRMSGAHTFDVVCGGVDMVRSLRAPLFIEGRLQIYRFCVRLLNFPYSRVSLLRSTYHHWLLVRLLCLEHLTPDLEALFPHIVLGVFHVRVTYHVTSTQAQLEASQRFRSASPVSQSSVFNKDDDSCSDIWN